jgi:polysaccharide biosynthesis protein PslF
MGFRVCHVSTFPPTQCGLATYVSDLICHQPQILPARCRIVYPGDHTENDPCIFRISIQKNEDYVAAASTINESYVDVVSLQHEFGIFGGSDGEYIMELVRRLRPPVVTTFHTVYCDMTPAKWRILNMLAKISSHLVVLTEQSKAIAVDKFGLPESKVTVVHHGVPEIKFISPTESALRKKLGRGPVFVSAGHIKPKKGHDVALRALAQLRSIYPDLRYLIIGAPQPQFDHESSYESFLSEAIARADLASNVVRINKYLDSDDFIAAIQAADIGLVTYRTRSQNSSGILPLILACGRPVVASDFEYARSIAMRSRGVFLVSMDDSRSVFDTLLHLAHETDRIRDLMLPIHQCARQWSWQAAAARYEIVFRNAASALPD